MFDKRIGDVSGRGKLAADMREIWVMQPRFEKRVGNTPFGMVMQPRFRAGFDFMRLRADVGEVDEALAEWWQDFQTADDERRDDLMDQAKEEQKARQKAQPVVKRVPRNAPAAAPRAAAPDSGAIYPPTTASAQPGPSSRWMSCDATACNAAASTRSGARSARGRNTNARSAIRG